MKKFNEFYERNEAKIWVSCFMIFQVLFFIGVNVQTSERVKELDAKCIELLDENMKLRKQLETPKQTTSVVTFNTNSNLVNL